MKSTATVTHRAGRPALPRPEAAQLLREYDELQSVRKLAELYGVSRQTICNWLSLAREEQEAKSHHLPGFISRWLRRQ